MFLVLAIILAAAWLFGFLIFHAAGFAIHVLLIVAIISVIVHFVKVEAPGVSSQPPG